MNKLVARKPNWGRLSSEWEQSGLSQKTFCEERGVSYTAFCYHRSTLRQRERSAVETAQFIPVTVEVEEPNAQLAGPADIARVLPAAAEVEVELPFGVVLRFKGVAPR